MSPAFRDLNHNGSMEPYEDPRRPAGSGPRTCLAG